MKTTRRHACSADVPTLTHHRGYGNLVLHAVEHMKGDRTLRHNITSCRGLYPAHTGTVSLATAISRAHGHPEVHKYAPWDHDHKRRIGMLQPPPPCYVMSVRDPVARLRTVFSFQAARYHGQHRLRDVYSVSTPSEFVRAFANASHPAHRTIFHHLNSSRGEVQIRDWAGYHDFNATIDALTPQPEFLRGLTNETAPEYHAICTSRMAADWQAMVRRMPCTPSEQPCAWQQSGLDGHTHDHTKTAASRGNGSTGMSSHLEVEKWLRMTPEEEAIVRDCMYPDDTQLNRALCEEPSV